MTAWKDHERRIARQVGGVRTGPAGREAIDVDGGWLAIECKAWSRPPKRVESALEQAERSAKDDQLPIAVIHTKGRHSRNDLVVLRWGQFLEWFGEARRLSPELRALVDQAAAGNEEAQAELATLAPDLLAKE